jgi:hypothetical protein
VSTTDTTGTYRLLIVAAEAIDGEQVRNEVAERAQGRDAHVRLIAPAVDQSKLEHTMGDVDEANEAARQRLEQSAAELERAGVAPEDARIGDADLKLAISDALAEFAADEILIVAHSGDSPSYERDWIEEAEREFEQPITEIFVERDSGEARVADVERKPAGHADTDPEEAEGQSRNMPPFSRRDVLGIVVAIVGTIALVILAATGSDNLNSNGGFGAETEGGLTNQTVRIIIAGVMALINLAHVIGLTLFQAGPYRGAGRDLFARLSLYGTPLALAASIALLLADD